MLRRKLLVALAVLALLGAACGDDDDDGAVDTGDTEETVADDEGGKVSIVGKDRVFAVDSTVEGGFVEVEFKNEGKLKHEAEFIKIDGGMSQADFIKAFKPVVSEEGTAIPAELHPYAGAIEAKAGETATARQSLPAGEYYLICSLTDADSQEEDEGEGEDEPDLPVHFEQGMISKVTVTGPDTVELPSADATIVGTEYAFETTGLKAGTNEVLFRNDGPKEIHVAAVVEFPEGVDEAAAQKAFEAFARGGPPPEGTPEPEDVAFSGIFDVGGGSVFDVELKSGRVYGLLCFINDRAGGPPHLTKGMAKTFKVA